MRADGTLMCRPRSAVRRFTVASVTAALLVTVAASDCLAYPDEDDVRRARDRVEGAESDVDRIQGRIDDLADRVRAADIALSTAAEDYDQARVELERSRLAAEQAEQAADLAANRVDGAQQQVGQLAAQAYREGGPVADLDVLLSPDGPDAVLERASMLQLLARQRQRSVRSLDRARALADGLRREADRAVEEHEAAAARTAAAEAAARQRATEAHEILQSGTRTRERLIEQLAQARRTSVAVERARQAGLREAAERRAEAAARARDEVEAPKNEAPKNGAPKNGAPKNEAPKNGAPRNEAAKPRDDGPPPGSSSGSAGAGGTAVAWARKQLGLPYRWGGDGPGSYDCSGLTMRAWQQAGVSLPHSSRMQYQQVQKVSYDQLRPGDLLFFATDTSRPGTIHHVAMYLGGGQMIEAPYTGANVRVVAQRRAGAMPYAGRP